MPWSANKTIPAVEGKSLKLRELFAKVANAALNKGQTEEEAIFAGLGAIKIEEKKHEVKKVTAPKVPAHLQILKDLVNKQVEEPIEKVKEPSKPTTNVISADINATGHLVLNMSDGTRVTTKSPIPKEVVTQNVSIAQSNNVALESMKEPTGFSTRDTSEISFSNATRTFTISATSNSFSVWLHAKEFTKASDSIQLPNISGLYYIYYSFPDCQLSYSSIPTSDLFLENALVSIVYWKSETQDHVYFADERHGIIMDGATHQHMHLSFGAQYRKGLGLYNFIVDGDGKSNSQAQFACDSGQIADEDITIDIIDGERQVLSQVLHCPIYYRYGSTSTNWCKTPMSEYPLILPHDIPYYNTGTKPAYNHQLNGVWRLDEVPNNEFVLVHLAATNDLDNPIVAILGNTYNTKVKAKAGANIEFAEMTGLPFAEFVKLGSVIYQVANSYTNHPKAKIVSTDDGSDYVDYRKTNIWSTGSSVVIDQTQNIDGGIYQE